MFTSIFILARGREIVQWLNFTEFYVKMTLLIMEQIFYAQRI